MPFLSYGKWIALALVAALILFLNFRIANLKTEAATLGQQIVADNATIGKFQEDQAARREVVAALQGQVRDGQTVLSKWQARANDQDKIIVRLRNKPAGPKQAAKEVVDDEGSALAIADLNRGWGLLPSVPSVDDGMPGGVYPLRPPATAGTVRAGP